MKNINASQIKIHPPHFYGLQMYEFKKGGLNLMNFFSSFIYISGKKESYLRYSIFI
jgi:hypothetical protein